MTDIDRGIVHWSGASIGSGVSVFYATPGGGFYALIRAFFDSIKGYLSDSILLTFDSGGDTIDDATGHLVGAWTAATPASVSGSGGGFAAAPAGASVTWKTSTIVPGYPPHGTPHLSRGRTFLVPFATNSYDSGGTLSTTALAGVQSAAGTLVTAGTGHFRIWHRPSAPGATDGVSSPVTGYSVKDRVSVLTSRR